MITRLTGVYNADGSLFGELSYFVGARLGRRHCALCDVTHGLVREKASWRAACAELPVPFDAVHLDERSDAVAAATRDIAPAVVAHSERGIQLLLGPEQIESAGGEPARLVDLINEAAASSGLSWPASTG